MNLSRKESILIYLLRRLCMNGVMERRN